MAGEKEFIESLVLIVSSAFIFSFIGGFLRFPSIVMYLVAGLLIGPVTGLALVTESHELIAETGIALMLFLVGLEMNIDKIRTLGKVGVLAGVGQIVITLGLSFGISKLVGYSPIESACLAVALTLSSTVVVIKLLEQKKALDEYYGRIAIGVLLVQDFFVIILLTILAGISGKELEIDYVLRGVGQALGGMLLLVGLIWFASKKILPPIFGWAARVPQTLFIWSLAWCFLIVYVAHALHLSEEVGAFLAGIGLAQLPYNRDLHRRVNPLMNFFIAIFFVSIGIKMDLQGALSKWQMALFFSIFVVFGKAMIVLFLVLRLKFPLRTALLSSLSLAQISEFSLLFIAMAGSAGLVGPPIIALVGMIALITISISSFLILYNDQIVRWLAGILPDSLGLAAEEKSEHGIGLKDHVIVIGMNTLGRKIASDLDNGGERVLAIDTDPNKLRGLDCMTLLGNIEYSSTLEEAGLSDARLAVSALQIEDTNEMLAYHCQTHGVPCSILAVDMRHMDSLLDMDVDYLMIPKVDGIKKQNIRLKEMGVLEP